MKTTQKIFARKFSRRVANKKEEMQRWNATLHCVSNTSCERMSLPTANNKKNENGNRAESRTARCGSGGSSNTSTKNQGDAARFSLMKYLPELCRIAVGALMFFVLCIQGEQAFAQTSPISEVFRNNLQKWIERDNLYFFKDSRGAARLFLRRETVRFALVPSSIPMREEVTGLIAELSKAAGVAYEETSTDVNLAIVVDSPINVGEKINPALWKRVGLSEEMYKIVEETGDWASGCGAYSFGNANTGQVGLSIVLADSKLDVPKMRDCLIDGVLKAFGARADRRSVLISEDGYYQFVSLVRALARCEQSIGVDRLVALKESEQKSKYAECAADLLSK